MSTATLHSAPPSDPISIFNAHLAHAKIHALRLLQDLMASLTDPDAGVGAALREVRLVATAILRTQPLKDADASPAPSQPPDPSHPVEPAQDRGLQDPGLQDPGPQDPGPTPPSPTYRPNLNPVCRAARNDIRNLIRAGVPEAVRMFPNGFPPRPPPPPPEEDAPRLIQRLRQKHRDASKRNSPSPGP